MSEIIPLGDLGAVNELADEFHLEGSKILIPKPKPNAPLEEKILHQKNVYERNSLDLQELWEEIEKKKEELRELNSKFVPLSEKTGESYKKLCDLESLTPRGRVLKQKSMLRNLTERYTNQKSKLYQINYIDRSKDYESKQRKIWTMEDKIKKTTEKIFNKIKDIEEVVAKHGDHGDSLEYILKEFNRGNTKSKSDTVQ